jgi:hypothetical protein
VQTSYSSMSFPRWKERLKECSVCHRSRSAAPSAHLHNHISGDVDGVYPGRLAPAPVHWLRSVHTYSDISLPKVFRFALWSELDPTGSSAPVGRSRGPQMTMAEEKLRPPARWKRVCEVNSLTERVGQSNLSTAREAASSRTSRFWRRK